MKRLLRVVVFALVLFGLVPTTQAFAATTNGDFSNYGADYSGITWEYEDTSETLTIDGIGAMPDFTYNYNLTQIIGYKSVKHLIISEGIANIGNYAMYKNSGLEDVHIASTVKTIGSYAFSECFNSGALGGNYFESGLQTITGMQGVETIGDYAFYNSSRLSEIPKLPILQNVGESAFYYTKLTEINAPTLTTVGNNAFKGIATLMSLNTPNLSSVGESAFENNIALGNVSIAPNPTIGVNAFKNTPTHASYPGKSTAGIGLTNNNDVIAEYNDYTQVIRVSGAGAMRNFTYNYSVIRSLKTSTIVKLVIEEGVTNVSDYFLYKVVGIPEVHIAYTVKTIGRCAFSEMQATAPKGLLRITGMQGVESIGDFAFYNSSNLASVDALPSSLTTIGEGAFQYTYGLNGLVNKAKVPQTLGSNAFHGLGGGITESERIVSANSTNTTFLAEIQKANLQHQIIYLDAIPDPADYTLEQWLAKGFNANDWFTDGRDIGTYITQGGTADSWGSLYGWYPNAFVSFGSASSGWLGFGGSSSMWTSTGGTAGSWMDAGGSGSSWVSGGGTQESFIEAGGTIGDFTSEKSTCEIILTVTPTNFSVTLPLSINVEQLADGTVVTPSNLAITNNSRLGPVKIVGIQVEEVDGWVVIDYSSDFSKRKVSAKEYSISLNNNAINVSQKKIEPIGDLSNSILSGTSMPLIFDVKLGARATSISANKITNIIFVVGWDSI